MKPEKTEATRTELDEMQAVARTVRDVSKPVQVQTIRLKKNRDGGFTLRTKNVDARVVMKRLGLKTK